MAPSPSKPPERTALSPVTSTFIPRSADREAATADPEAFVRHDGLMVIDEI